MTHYQKLLTIIIRFIGVAFIVFELSTWLPRLAKILLFQNYSLTLITQFEAYFPNLTFLMIGTIALAWGHYLAKLICFNLDE